MPIRAFHPEVMDGSARENRPADRLSAREQTARPEDFDIGPTDPCTRLIRPLASVMIRRLPGSVRERTRRGWKVGPGQSGQLEWIDQAGACVFWSSEHWLHAHLPSGPAICLLAGRGGHRSFYRTGFGRGKVR
jgi:hypothetical protein